MDRISVCLAAYNGEKFIKEQVISILTQLKEYDELIVSDNGSTDTTISILNALNDRRIKIIYYNVKRKYSFSSSTHYTISSNFENAIKHASGSFIFLADQDDIWLPNKVELMLAALKHSDLVVSNCSGISEDGTLISKNILKLRSFSGKIMSNIISPKFHGCCMAFKSATLDYLLPFPKMLVLHDSWIGVLVSNFGTVTYIDEDLMLYRIHSSNASNINGNRKNSFLFQFFYRITLWFQLMTRIFSVKFKQK